MAALTHKEKDDLIAALKEELARLQVKDAPAEELGQVAIGVIKQNGKYALVELKYDEAKNVAAIDKVTALDTHDFAVAAYKASQYLTEKVLRKARGDKYV